MRILLVGRFYEEAFATFIGSELVGLGHSVVQFEVGSTALQYGSRARFYVNRAVSHASEVVNGVRRALGGGGLRARLQKTLEGSEQIDLVLATHDYLMPDDAEFLKQKTGAPLALWFPDHVAGFHRQMFLSCPFDFMFFKDPFIVELLKTRLDRDVFYLPECYSPASLTLPEGVAKDPRYDADISTAGNLYPYRTELMKKLAGDRLKIWGHPAPLWMDLGNLKPAVQNRFVANEEKAKAFTGARIVLNTLHPAEVWGTNVRTFEICGAGGFQIVDWRPGLSELFHIDQELVAYKSFTDLRKKINYYLARPIERDRIARAGHLRASREHTYSHRLKLLLETIRGEALGHPSPTFLTPNANQLQT